MKIQHIKTVALCSIILEGLLAILSLWGVIPWGETVAKTMATLGIIFLVSVFVHEILLRSAKK